MKARVIRCDKGLTSEGKPRTYVWCLPDGCELPGKVYMPGHVDCPKGSFIELSLEPDYRSMLSVKVVQH